MTPLHCRADDRDIRLIWPRAVNAPRRHLDAPPDAGTSKLSDRSDKAVSSSYSASRRGMPVARYHDHVLCNLGPLCRRHRVFRRWSGGLDVEAKAA